jgi:hypothetical protein
MASGVLLAPDIEAGWLFTRALLQSGFQFARAFWLSDEDSWRFYVVRPRLDDGGFLGAYHELLPLLETLPLVGRLDADALTVVGPKSSEALLAATFEKSEPGAIRDGIMVRQRPDLVVYTPTELPAAR